MNRLVTRILGAALLAGAAAPAALAGGPNYVYDNANKIPYVWKMENWPGGQVPVYTDLGNFKNANPLIPNSVATNWAIGAWDQWNNVPTSTFRAHVVGDVSLLGLGDITDANVAQVYPKFNGGGITVVYDADGTIAKNYLGLPAGVLGISFMEFAKPNTNEILEGTVFIIGASTRTNDPTALGMSGVFTHEFGHALNLAHTQANGAVFNRSVQDTPFPTGCTSGQPYAGGPGVGPTGQQIETMYPFLDQTIGTGSSQYQYTVDKLEDIAAISDLYPAPGWPENYGTIKGTVRELTKILGNGTGPTQEVTGVNVIARNIADPYNDFTSIVTGGLTRGLAGPDGTFELHGLTPGASYVLYVDNLAAGAFPYPRLLALPGPEEWWNGANESGNGETDDRCAWTPIPVSAGTSATADITFNKVKGAPSWTLSDFMGNPSALTADGSAMVGTSSNLTGYWLWSQTGGYQEIGGFAIAGGLPGISDDGSKVAGNVRDTDGVVKWGIWDRATQTWTILPPPATTPQSPTCIASTAQGDFPSYGSVFGISGDGSTVVGSTYQNRSSSGTCRKSRATVWTAAGGAVVLPKSAPDLTTNNSRANYASYDGSVVAGYDEAPSHVGTYWINGVENFVGAYPITNDNFYGESVFVTRDGSTVTGGTGSGVAHAGAYKHYTTTGNSDIIYTSTDPTILKTIAWRSDDSGNIVGGFNQDNGGNFSAKIWTPQIGWSNLVDFLNAQGSYLQGTFPGSIQAMSADGRVWVGVSGTSAGTVPFRVDIPKAIVCHKSPGSPNAKAKNLDVSFPDGLADHLAHGDTIGLCQDGSN